MRVEGQQCEERLSEAREILLRDRAARMNYNVPSRGNLLAMQPQNFSHAPANAVAHDGGTELALYAQTEPAHIAAIGPKKNQERRI